MTDKTDKTDKIGKSPAAGDRCIDLGFAQVDTDRTRRRGFPEVIYCPGKTPSEVAGISLVLVERDGVALGTRATREQFDAVATVIPEARYRDRARCITIERRPLPKLHGTVAVVSAGTSDQPVAEEAVVTLELFGSPVDRVTDVGVAGLHRLLAQRARLEQAVAIIVVAGMEGALPSVVAGLVDKPVIAVPTSVGYGASFGGVAALLAMLNSCGSGVTVVNIDNGFGAAFAAATINRLTTARAAMGASPDPAA